MSVAYGGVLIAIGIAIELASVIVRTHLRKQYGWTQVPGRIVSLSVQMMRGYYYPVVEYEYPHLGLMKRSGRIRSLEISVNWPGPANLTIARYPTGSTVTVFVDTTRSHESVLEPGGDTRFVPFMFVCSGIAVVIGVWLLARV
jgi:hypothetical protein